MSNRSVLPRAGRVVTTSPAPVNTSISSTDSCGRPLRKLRRLDAEAGDRAAEGDRAQLRDDVAGSARAGSVASTRSS